MFLLFASLFFTSPAPLDMPRAEAYLVREDGKLRLEDRYDKLDLWTSQTVIGRWIDDEDRVFTLATLAVAPPAVDGHGTLTRADYAASRVPMPRLRANRKRPPAFRQAISLLASCALAEDEPRRSRQLPHGYRDVEYWQHPTNYAAIVCAFRPEKSETWYLAYWKLADVDDYPERMQAFEDLFLRREFKPFVSSLVPQTSQTPQTSHPFSSERELLRADARHSVAAYPKWHVSDSTEFTVIDDLPARGFVEAMTNEFTAMRLKYAAALPTDIDGTNVLCVARIYASRGEYLEALEAEDATNMAWTAAYWSPQRRELVAHLSENGEAELLRTIRHEAFHQYLSYATSMLSVSPWLNEGYAQYFEDTESEDWDLGVDLSEEGLKRLADVLRGVFGMDYEQFYEGSDFERRLKYRLAWSVAVFLEKGADKVRFRPFANLKRDYFAALFQTHDMRKASASAFGDADKLKLFVSEWLKFWKNR